jgi:DNA binding domain, excisionase family
MVETKTIFNVTEVAEYLNCSTSTIRKLVRSKEIPLFRLGAKLNFDKSKIDEWLEEQQLKSLIPEYEAVVKPLRRCN